MDRTKCTNENCKIKNDCLRFTAPPKHHQSYAIFDEKDCVFFIKNK